MKNIVFFLEHCIFNSDVYVHRNVIEFCMLMLYPSILPKSFISSRRLYISWYNDVIPWYDDGYALDKKEYIFF